MAETLQQLVELFKQQLEAQNERIELQQRQMEKQMEVRQEQMEQLIARLGPPPKQIAGTQPAASIPNFMPFDSMSELWKDYLARFYTFAAANSIRWLRYSSPTKRLPTINFWQPWLVNSPHQGELTTSK